jgi:transposase
MGWSSEEARGLQRPTTDMNTNDKHEVSAQKIVSTGPAKAAAVSKELFLGIDVAAVRHVVARFVPTEGVKPAEGMTSDTLVKRVEKLLKEGFRVHCVYEAGPTGFALARQLLALGVNCLVVRPRKLERYGRRRKTDPRDAQQLAEDLAHHVAGRRGLLIPVRVPTPEEELRRLPVRERETLAEARQQILRSAKGRALALGHRLPKEWWRPRVLPKLLPGLPPALVKLLERTAQAAAAMKEQLELIEADIQADAPPAPVGVGALTAGTLEREVCDWGRFKSGKKIGSFAGLCPSEDSSGNRRRQGAIDKHGSSRLRFWCQEAVWRLYKFQPDYKAVLWARGHLIGANPSRAKQVAVALARRFLVDWWRIRTGRVTAEALGLKFKAEVPA